MDDAAAPLIAPPAAQAPPRRGWIRLLLRVALILGAALAAWQTAENWNRWTGATRFARTDDAPIASQRKVQAALVQQAEATIQATSADLQRYRNPRFMG